MHRTVGEEEGWGICGRTIKVPRAPAVIGVQLMNSDGTKVDSKRPTEML